MRLQERHRDRGTRRARRALAELGRELREARLALGLRQLDVAAAAGVSRAWVSRIERGQAPEIGYRCLCVLFAVVGMDLTSRVFPGGEPLRDSAHVQLLGRFRALLPEGTPWRTEVPLPRPGDQRAWDAQARLWDVLAGIEAETRASDAQRLERRVALKARDGGVDRLILVLADTKANRRFVREHGDALRPSFPLQGPGAKAALRSARDPGCDLLVLA
jgi:transcriptional regulator with XRE-family HTH domain